MGNLLAFGGFPSFPQSIFPNRVMLEKVVSQRR